MKNNLAGLNDILLAINYIHTLFFNVISDRI